MDKSRPGGKTDAAEAVDSAGDEIGRLLKDSDGETFILYKVKDLDPATIRAGKKFANSKGWTMSAEKLREANLRRADADQRSFRLQAELPTHDLRILQRIALRTGLSPIATLRRAIAILDIIETATERGGRVFIEDRHGEREELRIR